MGVFALEFKWFEPLGSAGPIKGFDVAPEIVDVHAVPPLGIGSDRDETAADARRVVEGVVHGRPAGPGIGVGEVFGVEVIDPIRFKIEEIAGPGAGFHADNAGPVGAFATADIPGRPFVAALALAIEEKTVADRVDLPAKGDIEEILAERMEQVARTPAGIGLVDAQRTDVAMGGIGPADIDAAKGVGLDRVHLGVDGLGVGQGMVTRKPQAHQRLPPGIDGFPGQHPCIVAEPGVALIEKSEFQAHGSLEKTVVFALVEAKRVGLFVFRGLTDTGEQRGREEERADYHERRVQQVVH